MAISLQIGNFVQFTAHIQVNDGGQEKTFPLKLTGKRITREAMFEALGVDDLRDAKDPDVQAFLQTHLTSWAAEQKLVIDDATGQGAAFSPEALALVLGLWGAVGIVFSGYLVALGVKDAEAQKAARAKN